MTKVENYERWKGILLNTSSGANPSSQSTGQQSESQVTPREMIYTWWDRDNLYPNSTIRFTNNLQCPICKKQNNNLYKYPIAASQYNITKNNIPIKVECPGVQQETTPHVMVDVQNPAYAVAAKLLLVDAVAEVVATAQHVLCTQTCFSIKQG